MSFPALYLACQAVANLPTLDDEVFGVSWADVDVSGLDIKWVIYRGGAGLVFGVRNTTVETTT